MDYHSERHQSTRYIRDQPPRIANDLEDGRVLRPLVEIRLIQCFAAVAQRLVHADQHSPIFSPFGIAEPDTAGVILGDLGAEIAVVSKLDERKGIRFVVATWSQFDRAGLAIDFNCLWPKVVRDEVSANVFAGLFRRARR